MRSDPASSALEHGDRTSAPLFDAALIFDRAPTSRNLIAFGLTGVAALLCFNASPEFLGFGSDVLPLSLVALFCVLKIALRRPSPRMAEHVVVTSGAIRISRYVQDKLVEQRRLKLCDLAIELREDGSGNCLLIALRARSRTLAAGRRIEIACSMTAQERTQFLGRLLAALHKSGASPTLCRTSVPASNSCPRRMASFGQRALRARGAAIRLSRPVSLLKRANFQQ